MQLIKLFEDKASTGVSWPAEEKDSMENAGFKFNGDTAYKSYPRKDGDTDYDTEVYVDIDKKGSYIISWHEDDDKKDKICKTFIELVKELDINDEPDNAKSYQSNMSQTHKGRTDEKKEKFDDTMFIDKYGLTEDDAMDLAKVDTVEELEKAGYVFIPEFDVWVSKETNYSDAEAEIFDELTSGVVAEGKDSESIKSTIAELENRVKEVEADKTMNSDEKASTLKAVNNKLALYRKAANEAYDAYELLIARPIVEGAEPAKAEADANTDTASVKKLPTEYSQGGPNPYKFKQVERTDKAAIYHKEKDEDDDADGDDDADDDDKPKKKVRGKR